MDYLSSRITWRGTFQQTFSQIYSLFLSKDISYFIEKVEFKLHESFASPVRVYRQPPYEVTETGWGEFAVGITIWFIGLNQSLFFS